MATALPTHPPMLPRPESAAGRKLSKSSSLSSIKNGSFSWRGLLRLKTKQRAEDSDYDTSDEASSVGSPLTPVPENDGSHADFRTPPLLPSQMAAQRRTTFTKRVRRVFSSSSIAKQQQQQHSPLQSVDPHSGLGPFTPKPISRIHSSPASYTPAPPGGGPGDKSSAAAYLGQRSAPTASRLEEDRRAIQAQLSQSAASIGSGASGACSHSPLLPHHPHSFSSPSPLNSSAHRGQSSIPSPRSPAYPSSSGSRPALNKPHPPVPSGNHPLPGSKRMTRKPVLHFHRETLGLPVSMTNMPLPTPPPPSHAKESRFDLPIPSSSLASPGLSTGSGPGPHSLMRSSSYDPSHPLSLHITDLPLMPDDYNRRYRPRSALPTPVASPIPPPANAQRSLHNKSVSAQWGTGSAAPSSIPSPSSASALTPPLPIRNLLSTPPGSPADDAHASLAPPKRPAQHQRGLSLPPSVSTDALKAEVIARIRQMAVDSSDKDLTPPPSPPQSATTATSAIPSVRVAGGRFTKVVQNVTLIPPHTASPPTRISFTDSDKDVPLTASGAVPQFDDSALVYPPVTPCTSTDSEPEQTADGVHHGMFSSTPPSLTNRAPELAVRPPNPNSYSGDGGSLAPPSIPSSSSTDSVLMTPPMSQTSSASTISSAAAGSSNGSGGISTKGVSRGIDRQLRFAETVLIYETFDASFYDRRGEAMIRLTPEIAFQIKTELNNFKMYELEVHEDSRHFTHFIP